MKNMNEVHFFGRHERGATQNGENQQSAPPITPALTKRAELVDDFIRNYLSSKGLSRSLDAFQNEWYELQQKAKLAPEDILVVPDVYQRNQELSDALQKLRVDVELYKDIASKARATYDKLRKERNFHRMHHKRVVQEKNRLIDDIKRLKKHYEGYEPTLKQLQSKYEAAMKEKMLAKLERDRLVAKVASLETALLHSEKGKEKENRRRNGKEGESTGSDESARNGHGVPVPNPPALPKLKKSGDRGVKDGAPSLPSDESRTNPYLSMNLPMAKPELMKQIHVVHGHALAISSVKFHPKKMILATVSDDKCWKMWAFPSGELIMSGEGHKDWIADCDFHPRGAHLATASGDGTVKIWDFGRGIASLTLSDHTQAVWSCAFHDLGDYLATCSMDHTAKLWDVHTGKCRQTFRGHADSVNRVGFQPFSNVVVTCSGDKTISLWDTRTGLCSQTLFGHMNSINDVTFSLQASKSGYKGTRVASCDSGGVVKFWDLKNVSELESVDFGPHPANRLGFDASGNVLAVASNDAQCKLYNVKDKTKYPPLCSHEDAVQAVSFDRASDYLITAGSGNSRVTPAATCSETPPRCHVPHLPINTLFLQ
ncbi:WD40-repeat-containing domain protein [Cladochytrium replicatum]|nr:WD40-repeat-containing domain protein [Cladochytrium replicatum]